MSARRARSVADDGQRLDTRQTLRRSGPVLVECWIPGSCSQLCQANRKNNMVKCVAGMTIQAGDMMLELASSITIPQSRGPIVRVARQMRHRVNHDLSRGFKIHNRERESLYQHPASSPNAWLSMLRVRSSLEERCLGCATKALAQALAFLFVVLYLSEKLTTRIRKQSYLFHGAKRRASARTSSRS